MSSDKTFYPGQSAPGQTSPGQTSNYHNEQLDLIDVCVQLWRGKKIVIFSMMVALIVAGIYLMVVKEKWTSKAIIMVPAAGQVANYNAALSVLYAQSPQDKPALSELQRQLFNSFSGSFSALAEALQNLEEPLTLKIGPVDKTNKDLLYITFTGVTAKKAQSQLNHYINQVNHGVVDDYSADIYLDLSVKIRELNHSLETQKQVAINKKAQRIAVIQQALKIAEASNVNRTQLSQAEFLSDDTLYLLGTISLNAMITNEVTKPLDFNDEYYKTQNALLAMTHVKIDMDNLQSFRYISKADLPLRRDSPKKVLTIIFALMLGSIIGCAIVIVRNLSEKYGKKTLI